MTQFGSNASQVQAAAVPEWGPDRTTFTNCHPSSYASFDSIVDTNVNEHNFMYFESSLIGSKSSPTSVLRIKAGGTYNALIYFQNDVAVNVPGQDSKNARVQLQFPTFIKNVATVQAILSADNTVPRRIWSSAILTTATPGATLALSIDPHTVRLSTRGAANQSAIPLTELLSNQGTLIGCDALNGLVTGENRCLGNVTFQFTAQQVPYTLATEPQTGISPPGGVNPGESRWFSVDFTNTSNNPIPQASFEVTSAPGAKLLTSNVWGKRQSKSGLQGEWVHLEPTTTASGNSFSVTTTLNKPILPGDLVELSYEAQLDGPDTGNCGDKWIPITVSATASSTTLSSTQIVNEPSIC